MQKITRKKLRIAVNEKGYRIGESHTLAKLSDNDVELIRQLHPALSYREIARKFDVHKSTIQKIVSCQSRGQFADNWKTVIEVDMHIERVETVTTVHPLLPDQVMRRTFVFNTGLVVHRYLDGTLVIQEGVAGKTFAEAVNKIEEYERGVK